MRNPEAFYDLALLKDEPFKTQFPLIEDELGRVRPTRSQPKTFRSVARDTILKQFLDDDQFGCAAEAWLRHAFAPCASDEGLSQPSARDPESVLLFLEFYWHLYHCEDGKAQALLVEEKKRRGFSTYDSSFARSYRRSSGGRSHMARLVDGYEAADEADKVPAPSVELMELQRGAMESEWQDNLSSDGSPITNCDLQPRIALVTSASASTNATSAGLMDLFLSSPAPRKLTVYSRRKRKQPKQHPSSSSSSASEKGTISPSRQKLAPDPAALSDSTLTSLSSSLSSLSELDIEDPLTRDLVRNVKAKVKRGKAKHALSAPTMPSRELPRRRASNRHALSVLMREETRYHGFSRSAHDGTLEDNVSVVPEVEHPLPQAPARRSEPHQRLKKERLALRSKHVKKQTLTTATAALAQAAQVEALKEPVPVPPAEVAVPPGPSSVLNREKSLPCPIVRKPLPPKPEKKSKGGHKKDSEVSSNKCQRPSKKRRGNDGSIVEMQTDPRPASSAVDISRRRKTRLSTRLEAPIEQARNKVDDISLMQVAASAAVYAEEANARAEMRKVSQGLEASQTKKLLKPQTKPARKARKRRYTDMDKQTPSVGQNKIVEASIIRHLAPLPKRRSSRISGQIKATSVPNGSRITSSNIPQSLAEVDSILCAVGAEGQANLAGRSEGRNAIDWDNDVPSEEPVPDMMSSDDDVPLRITTSRRKSPRLLTSAVLDKQCGVQNAASVSTTLDSVQQTTRLEAEVPVHHSVSNIEHFTPPTADSAQALFARMPEENAVSHGAASLVPAHTLPKRPLPMLPPIWAQSRQEVCESFDWFRSYQGGVYFVKDMAKGYLLSAFSASRDAFRCDGKLIISHGGGKAESVHKSNGKFETHRDSDQCADDKSVRSLLRTYELKHPIALVIDDKYALFPFDLASKNCTYAVLGFYRIAHAWAEKQFSSSANVNVVRYKFAFQWCEEQGEPWWTQPQGEHGLYPPVLEPYATVNVARSCLSCHKPSPQVYGEGWMCLQPSCRAFWELNGGTPPNVLAYFEDFLRLQSFPSKELEDIRPPPPIQGAPEDGITTSFLFTKGWHCKQCGRLSSRFKWEHWQCQNCGNITEVPGRIRGAVEFRHQLEGKHFSRHVVSPQSGIIKPFTSMYRFDKGFSYYVTFVLPNARGYIHVIFSAPLANDKADRILEDYQREAANGSLKFRRWPLRAHKCRGTLLTNYFSQNSKVHQLTYNTVPWEIAPTAVLSARELIKERMQQALNLPGEFNEVLSAAYMEKQKMAFHSDAERGLGPTVASLSLGAAAYMHFRLHAQYASELRDPSKRDVLSLFLRHGDVVVMQGAEVQTYYEHTVVPLNFRVAATARFIDSTNHR
ncbi:unnamed protein product [Somion occarium]|uniref:Alpha-ketoglutarate-dependent dioxygenase AlkB-like domain-containing protein n=1 Tax=Somion occarium TaxID=3059160 RepID=A0ABP1DKN8_9APHY